MCKLLYPRSWCGRKTAFTEAMLLQWRMHHNLYALYLSTWPVFPRNISYLILSYLRIWGRYDPIESGPSEPKKGGLYGCSVKKNRFFGQKCCFFGPKSIFWRRRPNFLMPSWRDTKKTTFLCWLRRMAGLGAAAGAHFWPENVHFFTLHPYNTHFFGSHGPDSMG